MEKGKKENFKGNLKVNSIELKDFKFFFYVIISVRGGKDLNRSKTQFKVFPFFHVLRK